MRKAFHLHSLSGIVASHKTLRKVLYLHSFSSPPSSTFLGPNLPDVWVPRHNTSPPHTLLPQSLQWTDNDDHSAAILEGKPIANHIKLKVADEIRRMKSDIGKFPKLAFVLVGDRRDSHTFIHLKSKACEKVGIETVVSQLPENCTENELLDVVSGLNDDQDVHGIIVQLPLPQHLDEERIMNIVSPEKDVDGFHPLNIGNLARSGRKPFFIPCASRSCIELLLNHGIEIRGKRVAIIGRGKIAGLPTSLLLQRHHATVSLLHAYTKNPERITSEADIVVTDVGIPNIVRGDWIKKGAVVIDMGTNQVKMTCQIYIQS
ncbi:bifunctional protein FolD 1, mitochondrial isoform X2 [Medicago truncatula]|uniref:bifunctional protein FolD 1, mitochondrial isoform X2 n=1 Tax=Medicago truncatula TaxID=3880 RepID=UPI000D2F29F4|nr:bifunctional protein FolD 1, mitochondrial isoform X2 [Medicago truncatula]